MHPTPDLIEQFKNEIIQASNCPDFLHHPWFVKYHLTIVDQIAGELLPHYPAANPELVHVLAWIHDYGKTFSFDDQYNLTLTEGRKLLERLGFEAEFTDKVIEYMSILDRKMELDMHEAPLEVQIVSSADGCSHLVGPFMSLYWWENAEKPFEDLMESNSKKANKDWTRKIVLPEAREAFEARYQSMIEQSGNFPDKFIQ